MAGIIWGSLASLTGFAAFRYGKSMNSFKSVIIGGILMTIPIFLSGWKTAVVLAVSLVLLFAPIGF